MKGMFYPFDEWVYFKIYCNPNTGEKILSILHESFLNVLIEDKVIEKFFFIRYIDRGFHIRLRLKLRKNDITNIFDLLKQSLKAYLTDYKIFNIELSSYRREMKRYGKHNMENIEHLFYLDSDLILNYSNQFSDKELLHQYNWQIALKVLDRYFTDFGFTLEQKLQTTMYLFDTWTLELQLTKKTKISIDKKYRLNKTQIESLFTKEDVNPILSKFNSLNVNKSDEYTSVIREIRMNPLNGENDVLQIASDLIHMFMNKLFPFEPNKHELVIYWFAHKYYKSQKARHLKSESK